MPKQIVNISDTIKLFQEKFNTLSTDLGWRGNLDSGLEDSDIVGAINSLKTYVDSSGSFTAGIGIDSDQLVNNIIQGSFATIDSAGIASFDSADFLVTSGHVTLNGLDSDLIPNNSIDSDKIKDFSIDSDKIQDFSIDSDKIQDFSIDSDKLQDSCVSRAKLKDDVELIIYNSAGSAIKTLYGAGS